MIEFKNVYKTYPNGFTALKNINLQIEQGEFVAIIGLSGAGKSTILRCINRMHDISKGELTVDGVEVDSLRGKELRRYRRKVGMIFQSFNLVSRSTALKNVLTADVPDMPFFRVLLGIFTKEQTDALAAKISDCCCGFNRRLDAIEGRMLTKPALYGVASTCAGQIIPASCGCNGNVNL